LGRSELTPGERAELAAYEDVIRRSVAAEQPAAAPDVTASVLERIARIDPVRRHRGVAVRALSWLWQPRPISLRPALVMAAAVALLLLRGLFTPAAPVPREVRDVFVQFRLDAPDAERVELAGDFTDWQPGYALYETAPGVWSRMVSLQAGVYDYAFVIDGVRWVPDPLAPQVDDGFGGRNSRLTLVSPVRDRT
jgi:hypothetical protein